MLVIDNIFLNPELPEENTIAPVLLYWHVRRKLHSKYLIQAHFTLLAIEPFSSSFKHRSVSFSSRNVNIGLKALDLIMLCYRHTYRQGSKLLTARSVVNKEFSPFLYLRNVWFTLKSMIQCIKIYS